MKNFIKNLFSKKKNTILEKSPEPVKYRIECKIYGKSYNDVHTCSYDSSVRPKDKWEHYGDLRDWFMTETTQHFLITTEDTDVIIHRDNINYIHLTVKEIYE